MRERIRQWLDYHYVNAWRSGTSYWLFLGRVGLRHDQLWFGPGAHDDPHNLGVWGFFLGDGDPAIVRVQLVVGSHVWTLLTRFRSDARTRVWQRASLAYIERKLESG